MKSRVKCFVSVEQLKMRTLLQMFNRETSCNNRQTSRKNRWLQHSGNDSRSMRALRLAALRLFFSALAKKELPHLLLHVTIAERALCLQASDPRLVANQCAPRPAQHLPLCIYYIRNSLFGRRVCTSQIAGHCN